MPPDPRTAQPGLPAQPAQPAPSEPAPEFDLETLTETTGYNRWIASLIGPPPGCKLLELGCGIGNLTPFFLETGRHVHAIDIDTYMIERHRREVAACERLAVENRAIQELVPTHAGQFDAVVSSNVLEHIPDGIEAEVVRASHALLKPGGVSRHWVPAGPGIYGALDERFGHHRRYTRKRLVRLFEDAGFTVERCRYFNLVGWAGWWWNGRVKKAKSIDKRQAVFFDRWIVPVIKRVEPAVPLPWGQSLLIHARKRGHGPQHEPRG